MRFLYAVRDEPIALETLVQRHRIRPARLSMWLRRPNFRKALASVLREMRCRRGLELELATGKAARVLSQLASGAKGSHLERQSAFDILDMYFLRVRPRRRTKPRPLPPAQPPRALIHPEVPPGEAQEHLEALEARQPAD